MINQISNYSCRELLTWRKGENQSFCDFYFFVDNYRSGSYVDIQDT